MALLRTPDGRRRFEWVGGKLIQRSALDPDLEWEMSLVKDTVDARQPALQREGGAREADVARPAGQKWGPDVPWTSSRTATTR